MGEQQFDSVVLFGGGLDSCALVELRRKKERLLLLYFEYGAKAEKGEKEAMGYLSRRYGIPSRSIRLDATLFPPCAITNAPMTSSHKDDIVAGRNMIFAAMAYPLAVKTQAKSIYLCASPVTHIAPENFECYRDVQQPFIDEFNLMLREGYGAGPRLRAPLLKYSSKEEYVTEAYRLNRALFVYSHSCYQSGEQRAPCGECSHCKERKAMQEVVEAKA